MRKMLAVFLFLFIFIAVLSVPSAPAAEEPSKDYRPLMTYIRVDGRTCVAYTAEQFVMLTRLVQLVNELKRTKARGSIDDLEYRGRVSNLLSNARSIGVIVN
jgi:hypothetical protein